LTSTDSTAVTMTAACETARHWLCRGTVLSLTDAHGTACQCDCHGGDDLAIDLAKEGAWGWSL
jgi:hypothetical protein